MLMLTRRRGESVDIFDKDGNIVVTVTISEFLPNNVVRVGFAAHRDFTILRDNAKTREQRGASRHDGDDGGPSHYTDSGEDAPPDDRFTDDNDSADPSRPKITYKRGRKA